MEKGQKRADKLSIGLICGGITGVIAGVALAVAAFLLVENSEKNAQIADKSFPQVENSAAADGDVQLSALTGLALEDGQTEDAPIYCVQTPNGLDGARPQVGLTEAGVVFEAIAEAGITRFAAIYQEPQSAVIGPIRSLRTYYLQWDVPFDCTIVHAGGSGDALAALSSGGYKELDENDTYMFRSNVGGRLWNNLFTTASDLARYTAGQTSNAKSFTRMTPDESQKSMVRANAAEMLVITEPAKGDTSEMNPEVTDIEISFNGNADYSVVYKYDVENNKYLRSYANGLAHDVYECPTENMGAVAPENACALAQMAPSVVVAMVVDESIASDDYHEDIDTIGSGEAYVFQNGGVSKGKWSKKSVADQIKFYDEDGDELKLAVGQTFVEAVPEYGSIDY